MPRLRIRALGDPFVLALLINQNERLAQTLNPKLERHLGPMLRQVEAQPRNQPVPQSARKAAQMRHRLAREHPHTVREIVYETRSALESAESPLRLVWHFGQAHRNKQGRARERSVLFVRFGFDLRQDVRL